MKGALLVTRIPNFLELAASILSRFNYGVLSNGDCVQLSENGRLLTFDGPMWPLREPNPEFETPQERQFLDGTYNACLVDCRWEDLFCRVMKELVTNEIGAFFIIDNRSAVMDPAALDPATIRL